MLARQVDAVGGTPAGDPEADLRQLRSGMRRGLAGVTPSADVTATALARTGASEEEIVAALGIDEIHRTALAAR